jgi:hypothetical protein
VIYEIDYELTLVETIRVYFEDLELPCRNFFVFLLSFPTINFLTSSCDSGSDKRVLLSNLALGQDICDECYQWSRNC